MTPFLFRILAEHDAQMEPHELSAVFPGITWTAFQDLAKDIERNGLFTPITLFDGKILDGLHRYCACLHAGVASEFQQFSGSYEEAKRFVISQNLRRRHLTSGQMAMFIAQIADMRQGGQTDILPSAENSHQEAAQEMRGDVRTFDRARKVLKSGHDNITSLVRDGELPVATAGRLIDKSNQAEIIEIQNAQQAKAAAKKKEIELWQSRQPTGARLYAVLLNKMHDSIDKATDAMSVMDLRQMAARLSPEQVDEILNHVSKLQSQVTRWKQDLHRYKYGKPGVRIVKSDKYDPTGTRADNHSVSREPLC